MGCVINMLNLKIKNYIRFLWIIAGMMGLLTTAHATPPGLWRTLETDHLLICYQTPEDLVTLSTKVKYDIGQWTLFRKTGSHNHPEELSEKMDSLFVRVQNLLDMTTRNSKITIFLFPDETQFNVAYAQALNELPHNGAKARYIQQERAIYVVSQRINEGSLAKELAHAITNHYLIVKPTRRAADILASYVGQHLFDSSAPRAY